MSTFVRSVHAVVVVCMFSVSRSSHRNFKLSLLRFSSTQMYGDNNDKPGKKGIMLPMEQFEKVKELITSGEIDEAIKDLEKE